MKHNQPHKPTLNDHYTDAVAGSAPVKFSFAVDFFSRLYPLMSAAFKSELQKSSFNIHLKKGDFLVRMGEACTNLYIIKKGLLRGFIEHDRKDITMWMSYEKEFVTSISSFFSGAPSSENIQAIEDCDLEGISAESIQYFYQNFQETTLLKKMILEHYCRDAEDRVLMCRLTNARDRYQHLFKGRHRQMLSRAPLKHVASFLGIRLETLSRLRANDVHRHPQEVG